MSLRKSLSAILGLVFLVLGAIPLLAAFNVISFMLPAIGGIVLWILAVLGGVFLLLDALKEGLEYRKSLAAMSFIIGLALLALGLVPLLYSFGALGFTLPFAAGVVLDVLYVAAGLFLTIGAMQGVY